MTKIYLVTFKDENGLTWGNEAFTNLRKAKNYQRFWNAVIKNEPEKFNKCITEIKTLIVNNMNYLNAAIAEEMKTLPY